MGATVAASENAFKVIMFGGHQWHVRRCSFPGVDRSWNNTGQHIRRNEQGLNVGAVSCLFGFPVLGLCALYCERNGRAGIMKANSTGGQVWEMLKLEVQASTLWLGRMTVICLVIVIELCSQPPV